MSKSNTSLNGKGSKDSYFDEYFQRDLEVSEFYKWYRKLEKLMSMSQKMWPGDKAMRMQALALESCIVVKMMDMNRTLKIKDKALDERLQWEVDRLGFYFDYEDF